MNEFPPDEPWSELDWRDKFKILSNVAISIWSIVWAVILTIFGFKVYKIIRMKRLKIYYNDMLVLLVIFLFILALIFYSIFFILDAYTIQTYFFWKHITILTICSLSPVYFLLIACMINVRNWIHFYLNIQEASFITDDVTKKSKFHKRIKRKKLALEIITIGFITMFTGILLFLQINKT